MSRPRSKPHPHVVEQSGTTRRDVEEIFRFFERPENLRRATPENLAVALERHPVDLRPGSIFGYRLTRWPVDVSWEVVVSEYRPPRGFTTVKSTGYFPKWILSHEFEPGSDRETSILLRLEYEVPSGISARLANRRVILPAMRELVDEQMRGVVAALSRD